MKIKWGVIGCGGIADRRTLPGMMLAKNAELVAVMEVNMELSEKLREKYNEFYKLFSDNWKNHYKAFGFEMYASRFGGIDLRLEYASEKLSDFANGKISSVEELEEEILHDVKPWKFSTYFMNTCI